MEEKQTTPCGATQPINMPVVNTQNLNDADPVSWCGDSVLPRLPLDDAFTGSWIHSLVPAKDHIPKPTNSREVHKTKEIFRNVSETDSQSFDRSTGSRLAASDHNLDPQVDEIFNAGSRNSRHQWPLHFESVLSSLKRTDEFRLEEEKRMVSSLSLEKVLETSLETSESVSFYDEAPRVSRENTTRVINASSYRTMPLSPASQYLGMFAEATAPTLSPDEEGREIGDYVIGKQIAYGGYSVVKEAYTIIGEIRARRAVKIVRKRIGRDDDETESDKIQGDFDHEIDVWRRLDHCHILQLFSIVDTKMATYAFIPIVNATLFDLLRNNREGLEPRRAKKYCLQLADALRYLHEDVRIVHRDVKPENILLDETTENILLCDFGMAQFLPGFEDNVAHSSSSSSKRHGPSDLAVTISSQSEAAGSLPYASPETVLSIRPIISTEADVWAFGVVAHASFTGELPFQHTFLPRLQMMISRGYWSHTRLASVDCPGILDVISGCLLIDPNARWTISQVLKSGYFEGGYDVPR